jgi:hypothetical protein
MKQADILKNDTVKQAMANLKATLKSFAKAMRELAQSVKEAGGTKEQASAIIDKALEGLSKDSHKVTKSVALKAVFGAESVDKAKSEGGKKSSKKNLTTGAKSTDFTDKLAKAIEGEELEDVLTAVYQIMDCTPETFEEAVANVIAQF